MRLAVFDTNVIVSAGIRPDDAPAKLVMEWVLEGAVHLVSRPAIMGEYRKIAQRKKVRAPRFSFAVAGVSD